MTKRMFGVVLIVLMIAVGGARVGLHSQSTTLATPIQQVPAEVRSAVQVQHSHTSAATLTLPANGQFIYITGIDISDCAGGTAVTAAAPTYITTTNISGAPQWQIGSGVTAGLCTSTPAAVATSFPLKSQAAGTNVTVVLPTFATNQTVSVNVYYYTWPT
jgi:hypothetical protein